jgi:Zn-dependent protease with chaperone function
VDFFASQDLARRKTKWLVLYYVLAVLCMIIGIYIVAVFALSYRAKGEPVELFDPMLLLIVTAANLLVVGFGSGYKILELRSGGDHVAAMLGGAKIPPNTTDLDHRMLLNVVEEMALAAGIPVPAVYVLEKEPGINAFAAGYSPSDAVIGVNRGTLDALTREELQGVIAHEFSHIMNGDMRLNIRLIGILFGIQLVAMIGYFILRFGGGVGSNRRSEKNNSGGAILAIAFALLVFGSIGRFFARLIKASISRQREYLADASAVQFTRNPDGIAGALKVIGGHQAGSIVKSPEAEEASHMFFGNAVKSMAGAFATHPPLVDRIRRLDPQFKGDFRNYAADRPKKRQRKMDAAQVKKAPSTGMGDRFMPGMEKMGSRFPINPAVLIAGIGTITDQSVSYAQQLLGRVNSTLLAATREPFSARCAVFAFLLDSDESLRREQLQMIAQREGDPSAAESVSLWRLTEKMNTRFRLPVLEIAQGTLSGLSHEQYKSFRATCIELIKADGQLSIFEFYLRHHILMHLDRRFQLRSIPKVDIKDVNDVANEIQLLLSAFVQIGHTDVDVAKSAFEAGISQTSLPAKSRELREWKYSDLDTCLTKLNRCAPALKKMVLQAAATAMTHDHQITVEEAETFRAFAESIDCPVPPIAAN